MESDRLFDLVAALHEGVDDDARWLAALDRLSDALGKSAMFIGSTRRDGSTFELSGHRVDPHWIALVNGPLAGHEVNPIFAKVSQALREQPGLSMRPMILSRLLNRDVYEASAIYQQAIRPAGFEHVMAIVLDAAPSSAISLTLARRAADGDFTDEDARTAATLGPHLLSALRVRYRFTVATSGAMLLDCIDHPVFLVTGEGQLVLANKEGLRLLEERDGLSYDHGRYKGATVPDSHAIAYLIGECDRAARSASLAPAGIARLRRPSGRADLVVRGLPLATATASTFGVGALASVALVVHDPDHIMAPIERLVAEGLGLSGAEVAVAMRVWEGDGVAQAAVSLGLSPNTIKSHLKTIYETLGINRQSALVRRIAILLASLGWEQRQ